MLNHEQNALITHTGPGTPGGVMMRRYWQPVALSRELEADVPLPVTHLGEELVLFRDDNGKPQLIGRYCPHRSVDLSYGRVEAGGLRCLYHGWVMNGQGRCIQQPGEPAGSTFKDKIRTTAYPCHEAGGLILAYLGEGQAPNLPPFHFLAAPDAQTFCIKVHHECNYLQANEGNIDPQHLSILHGFLKDEGLVQGVLNALVVNHPAPDIEVQETAYGLRILTARPHKPGKRFVRITHFVMPNASAIHGSPLVDPAKERVPDNSGYQINWHVPIDDRTHWKYVISHRFDGPVDHDFQARNYRELGPDYRVPRGRDNRYRQDRREMKSFSYAGLGRSFYVHDKFATETQGLILDRSQEHLGTTDRAVILMRRQLLAAVADVQAGKDPMFVERGPRSTGLDEMVVLSQEVSADTELAGDWWRAYAATRTAAE
jgi:phenylpropionate dioxygenase-like ring-hydroxylating dioxygenase large terminal subunit